LTWRSPIDGVLLVKNVVEGAAAPADSALLRIADLSVLWLDAQVPESRLAAVRRAASGRATLDAAGREVEGPIVFVSPRIDPTTRTATVRLEVPNGDGDL